MASSKVLQKVTLEVLDSNNRAYNLYKKLGYQEYKRSPFSRKQKRKFKANEHIYMMKNIK